MCDPLSSRYSLLGLLPGGHCGFLLSLRQGLVIQLRGVADFGCQRDTPRKRAPQLNSLHQISLWECLQGIFWLADLWKQA